MTATTRATRPGTTRKALSRGGRHVELPPGMSLGRFTVGAEIGRGGFGVVYRGLDTLLRRDVAMKVITHRDGDSVSAAHEARLLARIHSPHVVMLFDVIPLEGADVLVLELVDGAGVDALAGEGALTASDVIAVGAQLAQGLAVLHAAGIVHGDIKPANLRFSADGVLKILDLGVAQSASARGDVAHPSSACALLGGTLAYMSPERLRGAGCDQRSDIWSAGAVLFELTTGDRVIDRLSTADYDDFIHQGQFPDPHRLTVGIPAPLRHVIAAAMNPDPDLRPESAQELLRLLGTPWNSVGQGSRLLELAYV